MLIRFFKTESPRIHADAPLGPGSCRHAVPGRLIEIPKAGRLAVMAMAMLLFLGCGAVCAQPTEIKLWPSGAPGETGAVPPEKAQRSEGERPIIRVENVSEPTLAFYPASRPDPGRCSVLVAPGGGYNILAWDLEGTEIVEWLNSVGVSAGLLKYRVPRRSQETPHLAPLQDAQRAMRLMRSNAGTWGLNPECVGMLGFSAGGNLTVLAGTHGAVDTYPAIDAADRLSSRPDFLIPVYPAYLTDDSQPNGLRPLIRIDASTPPAFILITQDDEDRAVGAAALFGALKRAGVPAELHVFVKGGHGYGLRPTQRPVTGWPDLCEAWMREMGYIQPQ